jgi:ribonuclease P protein component
VLPATQRVRRRGEFSTTVRQGRRAANPLVVVSLLSGPPGSTETARAGFVVGRAVGGAVVRNRVKRRLRHVVRPVLALLPSGSSLVVRALPPASLASSAQLAESLRRAVDRLNTRFVSPNGGTP